MTIEKNEQAVALSYDGKNAPTVIAKGQQELASEILRIAQAHDVMIHEDPVLLEVLFQLNLGDEIPEQLYLAVAQIIAFAYKLKDKVPSKLAE